MQQRFFWAKYIKHHHWHA